MEISRKENSTAQHQYGGGRVAQQMQWFNPQHVEKAEEVANKSLQREVNSPADFANKPPSQTQFLEVQEDRPHLLTLNQAMSQPRPLSQRNSNTSLKPLETQTTSYARPDAEPAIKGANAKTRAAYKNTNVGAVSAIGTTVDDGRRQAISRGETSPKADTQLSVYAATKKSNEAMAHSYSHLYNIPITMFRFFTVYGPWGRPDMALFKFTKNILSGKSIDVYNKGNMVRDFTYVDDLVNAIYLLIFKNPIEAKKNKEIIKNDSLSDVAPFRIVNIGNSNPVNLLDFIRELEKVLGINAKKKFLGMQDGDIYKTHSNTTLLGNLIGFQPKTSVHEGITRFVEWYKSYYL